MDLKIKKKEYSLKNLFTIISTNKIKVLPKIIELQQSMQ